MFLIKGQTDGEKPKHYDTYLEVEKGNVTIKASENGRYQISTSASIGAGTPPWIHETILDTQTGEVIGRDSYIQKLYKKHN